MPDDRPGLMLADLMEESSRIFVLNSFAMPTTIRLPRSNPAVKAAKRFLKRDQVFVTRHEDKPVANGVYYGFNETGFGPTMWFDENSRVKDFKVQGSRQGWFNRLDYTIVGKAVKGTFRRDHRKLQSLLLERVDPDEFDGSVASFSRARVKTLEGVPVDRDRILEVLELAVPHWYKPAMSYIASIPKAIQNALSKLCRKGQDGHKDRLITEADAQGGEESNAGEELI